VLKKCLTGVYKFQASANSKFQGYTFVRHFNYIPQQVSRSADEAVSYLSIHKFLKKIDGGCFLKKILMCCSPPVSHSQCLQTMCLTTLFIIYQPKSITWISVPKGENIVYMVTLLHILTGVWAIYIHE